MKYKNNSGLKQIALIGGKKEIIPNGIVFETDREIIHPAFERVDDATPVTFKRLVPKFIKNNSITDLQKQINSIQEDTKAISFLSESVALTEQLSQQVSALSKRTDDLDIRDDIKKLTNSFEAFKTENEGQFKVVFKRLEILKTALQTIELEVDQALYGDETDATKSQ